MAAQVNGFFPGELFPTTTLGGCIDIFEGAWPNPKETIEAMEKECNTLESGARWERAGTIGSGVNQDRRTNYLVTVSETASRSNSAGAQNIHNQMYMMLLAATIPYAQKHDIEQMFHEGYNMLRYSGGQEYKAHADGTTAMGRAISAIVYLNDEFEGGDFVFPDLHIRVRPEPGLLVCFPSNRYYRHGVEPVTKGNRYSMVTWMTVKGFESMETQSNNLKSKYGVCYRKMITYTWSISRLDCAPAENGLTNVVKTIHWIFTGKDENGTSAAIGNSYPLPSPTPESFTDYSTLTQETVIGWLESNLDVGYIKSRLSNQIASQYNPPITSLPLPWIRVEEPVVEEETTTTE